MSGNYRDRSGKPADARLGSKFGGTVLITRKVAAAIIGVDVKTLTRMRERLEIRGIRIATGEFRFSEEDIRAYLNEQTPDVPAKTSAPNAQAWDPRRPNRAF